MDEGKNLKPGRVGGKNSEYRSGAKRIPKRCNNQIEKVLQENRDKAALKEKKVGAGTQEKRETVIKGFFSDLFSLGFKIEDIDNLKQKHLKAVFGYLEEQGQAPSTIQNKISIMRTFCNWIGKNGMVEDSTKYVKDSASVRRTMVAQEDKSWSGHGINVLTKLPEIAKKDKWVALYLELCWAFGLRMQEALMFKPKLAHEGEFIWVREGTKGDRPRVVPIENDVQRDVLERAKLVSDGKSGFLCKRGQSYEQRHRRFYTVMESLGITLSKEGVSAHGLRHQYMLEAFKRRLGIEAPIKGGDLSQVSKEDLHVASQKLMESVGHTRVSIGSAYYGSRRVSKRKDDPKPDAAINEDGGAANKILSDIEEIPS